MRPLLRGLLRWGWVNQMTPAAPELPWYQKRIDLAFVSPSVGAVAIELKVDDWGRAVEQARLNRLLTPQSWVALWHVSSPRVLRRAYHAGIGVMVLTDQGLYPTLYPQCAASSNDRLERDIRAAGSRVRDLLSALQRSEGPVLADPTIMMRSKELKLIER